MPLLLTRRDLETVFADPEFLEQAFQIAQDLVLGTHPARSTSITLPLAQRGPGLNLHLRAPEREGLCVGLRVGPAHGPYATDLAELLVAPDDGALLALAAADTLDAWRRTVPSGLAARYLAPAAARSLGVFGADVAAWSALSVLTRALPSLSVVRIYSSDTARARRLAGTAAQRTGIAVTAETSPRATVARADIVAVTTDHDAVAVDTAWLPDGALLITQVPVPAGDTAKHRSVTAAASARQAGHPHATLADIMAGREPPRTRSTQTLVYLADDVDGWDLAMQTWTLRRAWQLNIGQPFGLD
ncbi:hypothetical protein [Marinactinospora rubrisoli]|uniref:Ornithine cyclodeaminase n=1 Tax=Marinactinospora rubrisoli TaxID=2715399 RepID=A0ABW2KLU3_9ACTN